jgi:hypothetical protein
MPLNPTRESAMNAESKPGLPQCHGTPRGRSAGNRGNSAQISGARELTRHLTHNPLTITGTPLPELTCLPKFHTDIRVFGDVKSGALSLMISRACGDVSGSAHRKLGRPDLENLSRGPIRGFT